MGFRHYYGAHLHRRLFLWFGVSIFVTLIATISVTRLSGARGPGVPLLVAGVMLWALSGKIARALCRRTDRLEQRREVVLEIAVVGEARLGIEVDPDLDVVELDLERACETGEGPQRSFAERLRLLVARQTQQRDAELGRQ